MEWLVFRLLLVRLSMAMASSSPNTEDQDAYGIKIAGNDILFVQANSRERTFFVHMTSHNTDGSPYQCSFSYRDPVHYIYTVGIGSKQYDIDPAFFYYAGEALPTDAKGDHGSGHNGAFVTVMRKPYIVWEIAWLCSFDWSSESIEYLSTYGHQEYFVIAVEPYGRYAIGVATDFIFRYEPYPTSRITSQPSSGVWPNNSTFHPSAADATESFTIVAGFAKNPAESRVRATPTVHILSNDDLTVLTSWSYHPPENSWQSYLTYTGIDSWSSKLTMSIEINDEQPIRVLIGMPFVNAVFLFLVSQDGTNLSLTSSMSYNGSVGFGKSVTWLSNTQAAILYSAYSPDYATLHWSKVYVYTCLSDTTRCSSPTAMIPNSQQPLPSTINANFIRMISTPSTLGILDQTGGVLLISSETPGFYASTDITNSPIAAATMPVMSHAMPCIGGTFKADAGIHPCSPCPVGSRNPSNVGAVACINCSADAFCPLGAVHEIERASLTSLSQAYPYPRSPELTVYEDLLLNNMVMFGSTPHCRRISPMFWTVILLTLVILMLFGMASLNLCVREPRRDQWRSRIKRIFLRTDLVVSNTLGYFLQQYTFHLLAVL